MKDTLKRELISIFFYENNFNNKVVEFWDRFVIKKHDGSKLIIGQSDNYDYQLDEFVQAILNEDEYFLIKFLDDVEGSVTEYIDEDKLMRENYDWMITVLNSEGKEFLSPDYALEEFDGRAYDIHEAVLDDFWYNWIGEMEAELEKAAAGLVDIYHYKGKDWYITPAVRYNSIRIPYLDYQEKEIIGISDIEYAYIDVSKKTKEAATKCLKILNKYKRSMELDSVPCFVDYFINEKHSIKNADWEQIIDFVQKPEYNELYEKLEHEKLADLFVEQYRKSEKE